MVYYNRKQYAPVAQLDRASASDAEGCGFDSRRVHQKRERQTAFSFSLFPCQKAESVLKSIE